MLSKLSLLAISFYQKFISPRKGYRCAYGVLHGTHGCSGHVKKAIQIKGVISAIPDIKNQFANCKSASIEIQRKRDKRKHTKESPCDSFLDNLDCCVDIIPCFD
ncbi:membrane protein insertion efficiency factor YidD [Vibrio splendidus]|nr:membrane protein insertion efficiency factor YidD [Vibrio splendidus]MCC4882487.1 membrane protein insertion efficiency factor YidD [Vibrio splendidus]